MAKTFNVGIVGLGTVAATHVAALKTIPSARIAAVCDVKPPEALRMPEGARHYFSLESMLEAERLDSVHICLPHYLHLEAARACASRGIPVLCEKPVGMNPGHVAEMSRFESMYGIPVAVCMQNRWNPTYRMMRELVASGESGRLLGVKGVALWSRGRSYYDAAPWRGTMAEAGGGCMINQAIHTLDQMMGLCGDVESLRGSIAQLQDIGVEVEDSAMARIRFRNGTHALFLASIAHVRNASIEIEAVCERAIYTIRDFALYRSPPDDDTARTFLVSDDVAPGTKSYYGPSHRHLITDFYGYLDGGKGAYVRVADAGRVIRVIDMIRRSSEAGQRTETWEEAR